MPLCDSDHLSQSTPGRALAGWPADLACLGVQSRLGSGDSLFLRERVPRYLFWVESGEIQLQRASPHGRNVILQRVREGFVAEASLQATRYHCDAIAAESSTIWSFPRAQVLKALRDAPELTLWWAARLAEQLRFARLRIERLSLKGASDRILHAIETEGSGGRFALASTRREWAAELGLTPEALYRSLAQLQRKGVVQIHGSELWLVAESSAVS
ncbi:MAG: Crp/Fnr family transcriptional regulator [Betaproteobacteria bacterium]|jgi:CRP-like cAMP-binding protein|nr:Crp/Fnr family transcriptional regulator [Betaproteobacteria bacterium]